MRTLSMVAMIGLAMMAQGTITLAAGTPDTGPGCGLGKLAWQNYPHAKTKGAQILMATTNGTFGSQTFGMTFGTSGCTDDGRWWAEQKITMFAELNAEALAQEMAQGRGEHLASMATLMGVPQQHHEEFFAMAQRRYATLASSGDLSPATMVKALNDGMASDPSLAHVVLN